MLDRILNINPQEKYKSGLKIPSNHYYVANRDDHDKHHSKDSALFSPLAKIMSKINWKILNIDYPSKDEISFNFLVDDLEFLTVVNFNEIHTTPFHEFLVSKVRSRNGRKLKYEIKLKNEKYEVNILNKALPIETGNLSLVFDRIHEMNINTEYEIVEPEILSSFIGGIEHSLNADLNYILKVLHTFISTKNKSRIKNNFVLKTQKNIPIIMLGVAIIKAE